MKTINENIGVALEKITCKNPVGTIYIDVDKTQLLNERFGHEVVDSLILLIQEKITSLVEGFNSHCCRVGGDKYLVLMNDSVFESTYDVANLIDKKINSTLFNVESKSLDVSISMGAIKFSNGIDDDFKFSWASELVENSVNYSKFSGGGKVTKIDVE